MLQHKKVGPMVEKCYFDEILMTFFIKNIWVEKTNTREAVGMTKHDYFLPLNCPFWAYIKK